MNKVASGQILFIVTLTLSCVIAWFAQPLFHGNDTALNTVVTIISILSGFSLLVISLLGDISLIPKSSLSVIKNARDNLKEKFTGQKVLYLLYVGTLLFAILTTLTVNVKEGLLFQAHIAIEYLFILISIFCLLVSFKLPSIIEEINDYKYEVAIKQVEEEERKKIDGIKNAKNTPLGDNEKH